MMVQEITVKAQSTVQLCHVVLILEEIEQILTNHYADYFHDVCIVDCQMPNSKITYLSAFFIVKEQYHSLFTIDDISFFLQQVVSPYAIPHCWFFIYPSKEDKTQFNTFWHKGKNKVSRFQIREILRAYVNTFLYQINPSPTIEDTSLWTTLMAFSRQILSTPINTEPHQTVMLMNTYMAETLEKWLIDKVAKIIDVLPQQINLFVLLNTLYPHSYNHHQLLAELSEAIQNDVFFHQLLSQEMLMKALDKLKTIEPHELTIMRFIQYLLAPLFYQDILVEKNTDNNRYLYLLHDLASLPESYQTFEKRAPNTRTILFPYRNACHVPSNPTQQPSNNVQDCVASSTYRLLIPVKLTDLTEHYAQAIIHYQVASEYYLAGWSYGGLLAYQVAQEITKRGFTVVDLHLIDSPFPHNFVNEPPRVRYAMLIFLMQFLCSDRMKELPEILHSLEDHDKVQQLSQEKNVTNQIIKLFDFAKQFLLKNHILDLEALRKLQMYCHLLLAHSTWEDNATECPFQGRVFFYRAMNESIGKDDELPMPRCDPQTWQQHFTQQFKSCPEDIVEERKIRVSVEDHFSIMNATALSEQIKRNAFL